MRLSAPRIAPLQDDELTDEQREALKPMGARPLNIFRTLARAPKALTRFQEWGAYVLSRRNSLPAREREIVILRVGFLCKSGYEFTQHTRIGLTDAGLTEAEIARIKQGADAGWSAAEAALIRAADELVSGHFVSDATWTELDSGEFERAVPLLEKAYQTRKDDPVVVAHLGLAYLRQNKDDKALAMLSHWAELEPNSPDALYFKGKASVYVASDSFDQLSKAAPDSYRMFQLRAEMLRQQGLTPAAISEYKKAIAQKPDAAGLHYALGTVYREAGRLDEALGEFNAELKISPHDAMTDYLIGDVYLQQNKLDDAQQYLTQALQLQPGLAEVQLDLAKTFRAQAKMDEAVKLLRSIVASDPTRQDAHYLLFGLYKEKGQMDEARKELQIFEELKRKTADREQKMLRLDSID